MIGFGGGQLEQLRQCPGADRRQASPEQAQEGRAGALPELRFDHAAAPATLARSEKSRTCSKSHGRLDPPWRSPDGPPCTGACWSDAARCGASISRRWLPPQRQHSLRAPKSCLMRGLITGGDEKTRGTAGERSPGSATTRAAWNSRALRTRAPTRLSGTPPYTYAAWLPGRLRGAVCPRLSASGCGSSSSEPSCTAVLSALLRGDGLANGRELLLELAQLARAWLG